MTTRYDNTMKIHYGYDTKKHNRQTFNWLLLC